MIDDVMNCTKVKHGESLPHSKLTNDDVRLIRELVAHRNKLKAELAGLTNKELAGKFDVHYRTIEKVVHGDTWSHAYV